MAQYGSSVAIPQTAPPVPVSLIGDANDLLRRLDEIYSGLLQLATALHGPTPRDATVKLPGPENEMTLRRAIDLSRNVVGMIEDELRSIAARL
jgi:hypothetical protein